MKVGFTFSVPSQGNNLPLPGTKRYVGSWYKQPLSFLLFTLHQIGWNPDKHWGCERWRVAHHSSPLFTTLHLRITHEIETEARPVWSGGWNHFFTSHRFTQIFSVSGSAFIPCIIKKSSNSWLNKCCYCFFHRSGSKSLYFSSVVFGCHSMVFSMTSLMYSNRLMPFNLHEIAIEYRIAPRLAPSCDPKNIEFLLDS